MRRWPRLAVVAVTGVLAVMGPLVPTAGDAAPAVVASVKPVHGLVAAVMEGVAEPRLLIARGSPHGYSLRPSEARALRRAELVFWIGPTLEASLAKPLRTLSGEATVVALGDLPGLSQLPLRAGGAWDAESPGTEEHGHVHRDGAEPAANLDPHLWLDPGNARVMVRAIVAALARADPANAARYRENGLSAQDRIEVLDRDLRARLAPIRDRAYVVFHDGYHHFERHYGLRAVGSIAVNPERPPGARRLQEIRARIAALGAVCVFSEPQFEPALVATVVEGSAARTGVLDPLGADIAPGPEAYFALLDGLARALLTCLNPGTRSPA